MIAWNGILQYNAGRQIEVEDSYVLPKWRTDDQDIADARQHQGRERIVDHRFIINRQHLLADNLRQRIQAGPASTCQNNAFHLNSLWFHLLVDFGTEYSIYFIF